MKIAVVGAGFSGLSAAYILSKLNHEVTLFEKEKTLGGLAGTFKLPGMSWALEKHYHHWFTNDSYALDLIEELGLKKHLLFPKTVTSIYYGNKTYPFNSPWDVLTFSPLTFIERLRTGLILTYLKILPKTSGQSLEDWSAYDWLKRYFGLKTFNLLWKPLLDGKFGPYAETVNMAWFWARIKKRTPRLGYLSGGYQILLESIAKAFVRNRGQILLDNEFKESLTSKFDKIIITTPSAIFAKMFPKLPKDYIKKITKIPHLHAYNLLLFTKDKILDKVYWLNINDRKFPFIAIVQQTNLISCKQYNGQHITWIANYLPPNHPYLKLTKEELLQLYLPFIKKINPNFNSQLTTHNSQLFFGPFAQPVFKTNYSQIKPGFKTPIPQVYLANMDMVYPWDRGTNYAIELGFQVAEIVNNGG